MHYQIDTKSNEAEVQYILGKQGSKNQGWAPKLLFHFFNMTLSNAYKIYTEHCTKDSIGKMKMKVIDWNHF